jgi:hypothetical protein
VDNTAKRKVQHRFSLEYNGATTLSRRVDTRDCGVTSSARFATGKESTLRIYPRKTVFSCAIPAVAKYTTRSGDRRIIGHQSMVSRLGFHLQNRKKIGTPGILKKRNKASDCKFRWNLKPLLATTKWLGCRDKIALAFLGLRR